MRPFLLLFITFLHIMHCMKLIIIIPAYNEQARIEKTVRMYHAFFENHKNSIATELLIVLNGCTDNTYVIVQKLCSELSSVQMLILTAAGKGLALKAGFADAVEKKSDLIGFVDADMATLPEYFYDLVTHINGYDGIIASRYMPGAHLSPPRPWIKRWGSKIFYEPLAYILFGLSYYDLQCGAKLFTRETVATIVPHLTIEQWACDVELLYWCRKYNFSILEYPTTWTDQAQSKLTFKGGLRMLTSLFSLRMQTSPIFSAFIKKR